MDWKYSTGYNFDTGAADTINFQLNDLTNTTYFPDPLIDWLPNSCLYTKYVPTWHLVRSYR